MKARVFLWSTMIFMTHDIQAARLFDSATSYTSNIEHNLDHNVWVVVGAKSRTQSYLIGNQISNQESGILPSYTVDYRFAPEASKISVGAAFEVTSGQETFSAGKESIFLNINSVTPKVDIKYALLNLIAPSIQYSYELVSLSGRPNHFGTFSNHIVSLGIESTWLQSHEFHISTEIEFGTNIAGKFDTNSISTHFSDLTLGRMIMGSASADFLYSLSSKTAILLTPKVSFSHIAKNTASTQTALTDTTIDAFTATQVALHTGLLFSF